MSSPLPAPQVDRTCPRCGLTFTSVSLDGLCPGCLLTATLDDESGGDEPAFWEDPPEKKVSPAAKTFSHFELLDELGRGGMGVVYRARDLNTERIVALKVLQSHHLDVPDLVQRFRSEVRAVSSLDHPYVLPIHEVGEHQSVPFFSMKLTTGGSLAHCIGTYLGRPKDAAQLLAKVARGVQHAHERGILHRDLKPGNILLDAAGEPYVCDFGLAKWIEDDQKLTVTAAVLGTPHYIAPEQAIGSKALTTAVDIYSLGAILYELLTGRPPFVGGTVLETLVASQDKSPDRPSSIAKNVPADLETICLKALEHNPSQRYATAGAFADDLENYVAGRPITARPVNAAEQLWRWAKRNPLPALLVTALLGTVITIAIGSTVAALRIDQERRLAVSAKKEAVESENRSREDLFQSLLAQAKASRLTGQAGQRIDALSALQKAAKIHSTLELRNEATAALSLLDMRIRDSWPIRAHAALQPVAFDASHQSLAMADPNGCISIYNIAKRAKTASLEAVYAGSAQMIRHSGSRYLVARYAGDIVVLYDILNGTQVMKYIERPTRAPRPWLAFDCAFSNDESILALARPGGGATIHETSTGREIAKIPSTIEPICLAFDREGKTLAISGYNEQTIEIWSCREPSPRLLHEVEIPARIRHIAWNPNREEIAVGCWDFNIYLVATLDGKIRGRLSGHRQDVTQVEYNHRGDLLASTSRDKTIRLWDLKTNTEQVVLSGMGSEPALGFSKNDETLSATDFRSSIAIIEIVGLDRPCVVISPSGPADVATLVASVDFSPDSRKIITSTYRALDLWDASEGKHLATFPTDATEKSASFEADENHLLVCSRKSAPTRYKLRPTGSTWSIEKEHIYPSSIGAIQGSLNTASGLVCVTNSSSGEAQAFNPKSDAIVYSFPSKPGVWDMVLAKDRKWAALSFSGTGATSVSILSPANGQLITQLDTGAAGTMYLSDDGSMLISTGDLGAIAWNTMTWTPQFKLPRYAAEEALTAAFSPTDEILAIATGQLIHLFSAKNGHPIGTLETKTLASHQYRIRFSPSGQYLAAQGAENSLRIWDLHQLRRQLTRYGLEWSHE